MNKEEYFCRCHSGWSGVRCDMVIRCSDCSNDSLCIGTIYNRSICICPLNKRGLCCMLTFPLIEEFCYNNGQLLTMDDGLSEVGFACLCPDDFYGFVYWDTYGKVEFSMGNIKFSSMLLIYAIHFDDKSARVKPTLRVTTYKLTMFQRNASLSSEEPFRVIFVRPNYSNYYLAVLHSGDQDNISTSIDSSRRCSSIKGTPPPLFFCETFRKNVFFICALDRP